MQTALRELQKGRSMYFQSLILTLQEYWSQQRCLVIQPYDVEKGAGTFNPATFLRALGPEPFFAAYVEPCRRPADGRYGQNPIRLQHYYQFQVVLKPNPIDMMELYIGSLERIGIRPHDHDLRFVHDDWESPTLGAWGLGWEVWVDGMEITQYTYFQQVGGIELAPIMGEITYGLERICMFLQNVDNVYDLAYNEQFSYGDLFRQNEVLGSTHNFEQASIALHQSLFVEFERECQALCAVHNPLAALDYCLKASHAFNLLDARGAVSVSERQGYILRVRALARQVAESWIASREAAGFPLLKVSRKGVPMSEAHSGAATEFASVLPRVAAPECASHILTRTESAPLLIEIGVEEMPAAVFANLENDLARLFEKHIGAAQLAYSTPRIHFTPRRIVIAIDSIRLRQPDQNEIVKGPPARIAKDAAGAWTKAAVGFAAKNQLPLEQLQISPIQGVDYVTAAIHRHGRPATELLAELVPRILAEIPWYKTMRWGEGTTPFVRPVQWLAAVLGDAVVPLRFADSTAENQSRGHRFLGAATVPVPSAWSEYQARLRHEYVIVDQHERRAGIRDAVTGAAAAAGLVWHPDEELLDEVTNLVEFPVPIPCAFDARYLRIPEVVLISEMKKHQKYFALHDPSGRLHHTFVVISNMKFADPAIVRAGYEKVLRSRFADAEFFLAEDLKTPLADRVGKLRQLVFQERLGSVYDKVQRVISLARMIAETIGLSPVGVQNVTEIASLCKADLNTLMVGEFPELQGAVGRHYASQQNHPALVADGILGHYLPRSVTDLLPQSDEAAVVGIADRLDTLAGIFAIGKAPTGSADPFALRRACLTTIVLIVARQLRLNIATLIDAAIEGYAGKLVNIDSAALRAEILEFFLARLTGMLHDGPRANFPGKFALDSIQATVHAAVSWHDLTELIRRIEAMEEFRRRPDFTDVAATFKRANNIIRGDAAAGAVSPALFRHPQESNLWTAVQSTRELVTANLCGNSYLGALSSVAPLRGPVNEFFDAVLVNDPDATLRANRRSLLHAVVQLVQQMADFSLLQVADSAAPTPGEIF